MNLAPLFIKKKAETEAAYEEDLKYPYCFLIQRLGDADKNIQYLLDHIRAPKVTIQQVLNLYGNHNACGKMK